MGASSKASVVRSAACVAAVLTYEGAAGLALVAVAAGGGTDVFTHSSRTARLLAVAAVGAATAYAVLASPWQDVDRVDGSVAASVEGSFGVGTFPGPSRVLGGLLLAVAVWAVAVVGLRRPASAAARLGALGALLWVAGSAPFLAARFATAMSGLFDRGNLYASVGVAVLVAATAQALVLRFHLLAPVWASVAIGVMAAANLDDVQAVDAAQQDARWFLAAVTREDPSLGSARRPLVFSPLPDRSGWKVLVESYDTTSALRTLGFAGSAQSTHTNQEFEGAAHSCRVDAYRVTVRTDRVDLDRVGCQTQDQARR